MTTPFQVPRPGGFAGIPFNQTYGGQPAPFTDSTQQILAAMQKNGIGKSLQDFLGVDNPQGLLGNKAPRYGFGLALKGSSPWQGSAWQAWGPNAVGPSGTRWDGSTPPGFPSYYGGQDGGGGGGGGGGGSGPGTPPGGPGTPPPGGPGAGGSGAGGSGPPTYPGGTGPGGTLGPGQIYSPGANGGVGVGHLGGISPGNFNFAPGPLNNPAWTAHTASLQHPTTPPSQNQSILASIANLGYGTGGNQGMQGLLGTTGGNQTQANQIINQYSTDPENAAIVQALQQGYSPTQAYNQFMGGAHNQYTTMNQGLVNQIFSAMQGAGVPMGGPHA